MPTVQIRRRLGLLTAIAVTACAMLLSSGLAPRVAHAALALPAGSEDAAARAYYRMLLKHTRWVESTWDNAAGHYRSANFDFTNVLGNAVLLKFGTYDPAAAGVAYDVLKDHTVRTIAHFAASNHWNGGTEWGGRIYWDSTFESYFAAAAKIMDADLDATTRSRVNALIKGEAAYVTSLAANPDPRSTFTTNGLTGGWRGDSKIEEMGARSMPLAAGAGYLSGDTASGGWRQWLTRWTSNMAGLPVADEVNPTVLSGQTVAAWNTARNIHDSFVVENHGSFAPIYQLSAGAYPGRNLAAFLLTGQPIPQELLAVPNGAELSTALRQLGTDSGVAADLAVADRHHLYGRMLLPLAYWAMATGDRDIAAAEQMLLARMGPYQDYPPSGRLTKFSGEPKYEPEARAEVAMAYLLHYYRARLAGDVIPVSEAEYFARASNASDRGAEVGIVGQQSGNALAAAVTKAGYTKFAYLPQHDDWLFDVSGKAASLLPSTGLGVTARNVRVYNGPTQGFEGAVTVLTTAQGRAGFATLPGGQVVYATSGLAADEGVLRLYNLLMPGMAGLDGDRTFTWAGGTASMRSAAGLGDGGIDELTFPAASVRWIRMLGTRPATVYGYSLWSFEAYPPGGTTDLARGRPTTASSYSPGYVPASATDGNTGTRWAVSTADRPRLDSWLTVDMGSTQSVGRVKLSWETAYGSGYRIQGSQNGTTWTDLATVPQSMNVPGNWLDVDGRAAFVKRGGTNPIKVAGDGVVLSSGPATGSSGMVVEGYPTQPTSTTAALAAAPAPTSISSLVRASLAGGYLTVFNLSAAAVNPALVTLPAVTTLDIPVYQGFQEINTTTRQTVFHSVLAPGAGMIQTVRFRLRPQGSTGRLQVHASNSHQVTVTNLNTAASAQLTLASTATGETANVTIPAGGQQVITFSQGPLNPSPNAALGKTTYPTSPLPPGMTDPDHAVDGNAATAWNPGASGRRMVVDLGAARAVRQATPAWAGTAPQYRLLASANGLSWTAFTPGATARYLAVEVQTWTVTSGALSELDIR